MKRFSGKVVFVTGAGRGIGKSVSTAFAEEEARVCLVDIEEESLSITVNELKEKGHEVRGFAADISNPEKVNEVVDQVAELFGKIDILVNNAGVLRDNILFKMSDSDWDTVMNVHLKGTFNCSRAIQKYMVKHHFGRIINISSTSALGNRGQANYSTAKAGLQGFTKTLAIELGAFGITVNAVAPGFIETDMTKATAERMGLSFGDLVKYSVSQIPVGRSGQPEDIANAVLFFAMDESSFVNGQVLYVAGGPKN
ncbi:3-oxoacyl-[acyl-carrier protein] reductase [Pullulanibacillus pueri]|uniref:3-oxoacyl-ACP reductase n=1 Tax=Pullulanibacillus pueri TaxID=1437324 RepID=A0A8J2ZWD7_9BACL|nr:3-oxoacyl-ACP reductase FabG [Pullulanibacillus pueri]MBM7682579.1 3-oxoacyl-[acyl-carrier protein] reductase [Pullulanibacillus pueri]GGH82377.1 3-oxoacyl-ACP reductase [Pullulanibacillus pueri]